MDRRAFARAVARILCLALPLAPPARADEAVWAALKDGGQVVLLRHALTHPGFGDPPGMRLDDCASQRNLSDAGRNDARRLGEAFRDRSIPVGQVLTSPWCRCRETARLAFGGDAEAAPALGNLHGRPEREAAQVEALRTLVTGWHGPGNLVLVSHGSTILALTGIHPAAGEMVVLTPRSPAPFVVRGRLVAH